MCNSNKQLVEFYLGVVRIFNNDINSINMPVLEGFRETAVAGFDDNMFVSCYDGQVYQLNNDLNAINSLKAYGKPEGMFGSSDLLAIATPYLADSDEPDSTVTIYVDEPESVKEKIDDNSIKVFPNPADNIINFDFSEFDSPFVKFEIFNFLGEKVYESASVESDKLKRLSIEELNLMPGANFVKIWSEKQFAIVKLMIIGK